MAQRRTGPTSVRTYIEVHRSLRAMSDTEALPPKSVVPEHLAAVRVSMPDDELGVVDVAVDVKGLAAIGLCQPGKISFRTVDGTQLRSIAERLIDAVDRAESLGWFKEQQS